MIGKNLLLLNKETVAYAIQEYLNNVHLMNVVVNGVIRDQSNIYFEVSVEARKIPEEVKS